VDAGLTIQHAHAPPMMQAGVMVVVARITNAEFVGVGLPRASLLGQQVEARSVIELQRRNTTVVFKQMLYHADRLVAKAEIACVCIRYLPSATWRGAPSPPSLATAHALQLCFYSLSVLTQGTWP